MEPKGLDRTALLGILLMSVLLGVWMIANAPSPEEVEAQRRQAAIEDSLAAVPDEAEALPADTLLETPTDSAFARAVGTVHGDEAGERADEWLDLAGQYEEALAREGYTITRKAAAIAITEALAALADPAQEGDRE